MRWERRVLGDWL
uniref:Uncharacterized protein n=1 Tax=Arundo donax TaxID=35708 RepID=A0A0A9CIH1_ARUDO